MTKTEVTGTISIQNIGPLGDGIHNSDRGPVYVERTLPGDDVEARIQRGSGGVLRGEVSRIATASPHRVDAPCSHYAVCGGCTIQHAAEAFYRDWKVGLVQAAFQKARLTPERWAEPVFVPAGTRRRVTFAAYKKGNVVTLGYFKRRSHVVTDIDACLIADPEIMKVRAALAAQLQPLLPGGKTVDVFIQSVDGQCDVVITGPIGPKGTPDLQVYETAATLAHRAGLNRLSWRPRESDTPDVLIEINPVFAAFGTLRVPLPPLAFLQPTKQGEAALVDSVMAALPKGGRFADLFAGSGTFSGPMLEHGQVDAYESSELAVRALDKAESTKPLRAIRRDLFRQPLLPDETKRYDALVFDPPRAGAESQAAALASSNVPCVIGVSCNPTTFARDAQILLGGGYKLEQVKIVDQFTWSHHVELVGVFRKS
jgi:23S rRNA (uracil1939-C5)-methyltransferase